MNSHYKSPGVYIEEMLPSVITSVETAIPAFIGYTEKAELKQSGDLKMKPWRIQSMAEYERYFGYPSSENGSITVVVTTSASGTQVNAGIDETLRSKFLMHYSMQMFFANGGGACWITSAGDYTTTAGQITAQDLEDALAEVAKINEVTLLLFPDAINLSSDSDYYGVYSAAIQQAAVLQDRFVVMDVYHDSKNSDNWHLDIDGNAGGFRNMLAGSTDNLKYAAAYFPQLYTTIEYNYKMQGGQPTDNEASIMISGGAAATLADLKQANNAQYLQAKNAIKNIPMLLPASPAIAGIYATVDNNRGVWKAPANINIQTAIRPQYLITQQEQENLNIDINTGKSINVIRTFPGHGPAIVWGARTLAGNDNDWRYISVRRFFMVVEKSVKNATQQLVFEPNAMNTWVKIKSMISDYLTEQWKFGALLGTTPKDAFFVRAGLGETMTAQDVLEGQMIVEIGMAVVRPAEFIILRIVQKMLKDS